MFHYDKAMLEHESEAYGINHQVMYRDSKENELINDFGIYVLSRLHTFQNMKALRVDADTDIAAYVRHSTELLDGNRVYRFSRELLAFLETMVAFSPYHVANNPNAAGPADAFYEATLARYKQVTYEKLHDYLEDCFVQWYKLFPPDDWAADTEEEGDGGNEENGDHVETENTEPAEDIVSFKTSKRSSGAPAIPSPGAADGGAAASAAAPPAAAAAVEAAAE